jgi:hypothetical protein
MRMAKPNQVPESSMEEILASIRKIISEDEAKLPAARPASGPRPAPTQPVNNVSPLFRDEFPRAIDDKARAEPAPTASRPMTDEPDEWISQRPIYSQFGEMRGTSEKADGRKSPEKAASRAIAEREARPSPRPELPPAKALPGGTLLSPRADAAVTSAFNHLAGSMLSTNSRSIEQVAEDMLRPMLKDWLDENLPPMVERLVREEIERVSRRR